MTRFKDVIFCIMLFASIIYFSFEALLGNNLLGVDEAPSSYKIYCIVCFTVFFLFYFCEAHRFKLTSRVLISYLIIGIYILASFVRGYWNVKAGLCLIAFCLPASCIGIYYARTRTFVRLMKYLDILIPFLAASLVFMTFDMISVAADGIKQYSQDISNIASLCYLFSLFVIVYGDTYERFKICSLRWYKYLYYILLPYFLFIIFFSGGRGGFVIVFIGTLLVFFLKKPPLMKVLKAIGIICVAVYVVFLIIKPLWDDSLLSMLQFNFERIFSYISSSGLDMSETSNRDLVYNSAFECIGNSPIWGYGLYGYIDVFGYYPHNIFLELLMQGGLLYLTVALLFAITMINKLLIMQKRDKSIYVLLPFMIFPCVQLQFTGSYMENPFFWFSLMFIFNFDIGSKKIDNHSSTNEITNIE